jgi:hypothetical protein
VGFTLAGSLAAVVPLSVPWLPLVAPVAVVVMFILVMLPFWGAPAYRRKP